MTASAARNRSLSSSVAPGPSRSSHSSTASGPAQARKTVPRGGARGTRWPTVKVSPSGMTGGDESGAEGVGLVHGVSQEPSRQGQGGADAVGGGLGHAQGAGQL